MDGDATFSELTRAAEVEAAGLGMNEDAFRGFYERNARGLWAYLARLTGSRELADDLLQETFYRFLRAASHYESEGHRRNSLYRIAGNLARDEHRRALVRRPFAVSREDLEQLSGRDQARSAERSSDLARALRKLKPRERAMLWLAYAEGASHEEISGALGIHAASLKSMLYRARHKLAQLLGGGKEATRT